MNDVTRLLDGMDRGEPTADDGLLSLVYDELRCLARRKLAREPPGQTIQATELVHEVWLRLLKREHGQYVGRRHFFLAAAEAMRRILVDRARRKRRRNHGEGRLPLDLDAVEVPTEPDDDDLLIVHEALDRLAAQDPQKAHIVKLRYFAGLNRNNDRKPCEPASNAKRPTVFRAWISKGKAVPRHRSPRRFAWA
jgi:RNA polymerase sigma factor (TIGR02999 family)